MPTRYRDRLQIESKNIIVITIDTEEKCLLLFHLPEWEEIEKKIAVLPSFNPAARRIQRLLIGHATEVELDGQGRLLLPPLLREYADLKKHAVLVGQGKKLELWNDQYWETCRHTWLQGEAGASLGALPEEINNISL